MPVGLPAATLCFPWPSILPPASHSSLDVDWEAWREGWEEFEDTVGGIDVEWEAWREGWECL